MITIRTKNTVNLADAIVFEEQQGDKKIKKLNIFHKEPCRWELRVGMYSLGANNFSAPVSWFQKNPYETGNPMNPIATIDVVMFQEIFTLPITEVQLLWESIEGQILTEDNLVQKMEEFVKAGTMHWIGVHRQVFGLDKSGFEII